MSRRTASPRPGQDRANLYDEITDKIVAELEAGRVPWVQPWGTTAAKAPLAMPKNASTGRHYSGINILILWGAVVEHGFPGQSWLTFRQALSLGGNVRKGARGTTVVYADRFTPEDEKRRARESGEDAQAIPFLKRFTVFNAAQCEGLPEDVTVTAESIAAEGWKWIEVAVSFPYDTTRGLRELQGEPLDLSAEEQATIEALNAEYQKLEAEYEGADELPDEVDQRLSEIETALAAFETRPMRYEADDIPRAGVFISVAHDGTLAIDRGYVRAEDEAPIDPEVENGVDADGDLAEPSVQRAVITIGGQPAEPEDDEDDGVIKPLPERLVIELTAYRTLALRNAVAENPHVAMTALLHKLVSDTFMTRMYTGTMEAGVKHVFFPAQDDALKDSPSARAVQDRHAAWAGDIPKDDAALWDWLADLDEPSRMALLAHCVSYGVNALYERPNPHSGSGVSQHTLDMRLSQADRLTKATGLDLVEAGWRPTFGNYLNRVTKPRILQAVREGAGEQAAQLIDHLKKGDMAKEAERLLADTGWLPEPLRVVAEGEVSTAETQTGGEDDGAALPDFLASDDEEAAGEDDERHLVAAE